MASIPLCIGRVRAWLLDCGEFPYDAGVLFGAVPRADWGRRFTTDSLNRIAVGLRPLLVEGENGWIIVDTALPEGETEYGERLTPVSKALAEVGVAPQSVKAVVLTHLHPDHAGGNFAPDDPACPFFPAAGYYVQRHEAAAAAFPNERTRADYDQTHVRRLEQAGALRLVAGAFRLDRAVTLLPSPGHTPGHQCVLVADGDEAALFVSDLAIVPVQAERLTWISALDTHPMQSLESKRALLGRAVEKRWRLIFTHEASDDLVVGHLEEGGERRRWHYVPDTSPLR